MTPSQNVRHQSSYLSHPIHSTNHQVPLVVYPCLSQYLKSSLFSQANMKVFLSLTAVLSVAVAFPQDGPMGRSLLPFDRQADGMDAGKAAELLTAVQTALDPANCGAAPSYYSDDWVNCSHLDL